MNICRSKVFKCEGCGNYHLLPFEILNIDKKEKPSVMIECPNKHTRHLYRIVEFENCVDWMGPRDSYSQVAALYIK